MQKLMDKMENVLAPLATKIGSNKILKAISTAFNLIMPLIILGAIFTLLSTLSLDAYQQFLADSGVGTVLSLVGKFTTDMLAVYVSFTAAYAFIRNEGMNTDAIPAGLLSILAFFIMTPLANIVVEETTTSYIAFDYLGSKGLFTALIVGILVGYTIPFSMMLFMQAGVENQAAFASGAPMQNIITVGLLYFLMLGGIGNTLGLSIDMLLAKSNRYKTLGRLAILPSCCSINEPIVFGLPLILNPIMALPYFLVPQINILITYFAMKSGLVSLPRIAMGATGTPVLLDGWLICGVSGIILEIVLIIVSAILYYPFFKTQDNIALKEEAQIKE